MIKHYINGTLFVTPTGHGVRSDSAGDGHHGSSRGARKHDGIDLKCTPDQPILMPVTGDLVRISFPYKNDLEWRGVHIYTPRIEIKMWYLEPIFDKIGQKAEAGDIIGYAQDISKKNGYEDVTPHIHLRIVKIDPLFVIPVKGG